MRWVTSFFRSTSSFTKHACYVTFYPKGCWLWQNNVVLLAGLQGCVRYSWLFDFLSSAAIIWNNGSAICLKCILLQKKNIVVWWSSWTTTLTSGFPQELILCWPILFVRFAYLFYLFIYFPHNMPSRQTLLIIITKCQEATRGRTLTILFQPLSLKFTNSFLLLKVNNVPWIPSQLSFWNSASMNSVQSSQILSISLFLKEFFHRHSNKHLSSLFSKNHLYPLMISTTFVQFQTSSSFPKLSKKLLLPAFNLTCLITHCLLLFSLLTGSFTLLKLLFSKFTMTSSLRWIVVRSLHSFFSTYLLPSILSIISSFLLVFKIGSVLMVCLLIGSHLISHFALGQSQSMIPSLHSLLFPVVYPKVPYFAHSFSFSIQLLLARWSQKIPSNIICTLMTPSCTSLLLLQILLYLLKHLPPLLLTFSSGWTWTNFFSIPQKLNFFSLAQNNNVSNFLI